MDAVKGRKTVNEFARTYGVPPTQITPWKPQRHKEGPQIFSARRDKRELDQEARPAPFYQHIGPRQVELDWWKKQLDVPRDAQREWMEPSHPPMRRARQGDRVGWPRSTSSS